MHQALSVVLTVAAFIGLGAGNRLETRDSYEIEPGTQISRPVRWPNKRIQVSLSTSLLNPGPNIKAGSDVVGAASRSFARWSSMANIKFVVTWSTLTSVSPAAAGDGVSLITIADSTENEAFNSDSTTGRTRIFYDRETGDIAEADVSINPKPKSQEGAELQFSTDGSPGTYDLEATFTHEIGHLLGLDHSAVLASTMQSKQAFNGTFGMPALTERTLSEDDRQRIRSLYGPNQRLGKIEGKLSDNRTAGLLTPLAGVSVWAESASTGRVVASDTTDAEGNYRLDGLIQGRYRVMVAADDSEVFAHANSHEQKKVRSFEVSNNVTVTSDSATVLNNNLVPAISSSLTPRLVGINAELSTVAVPLEPGKRTKVYLSGEGIDQVPGESIIVSSPYFTVDPATLTREQIASPFPVVSIEVTAAPNVPFGDYTIRLQSNSGEVAFVPGGVTIDPGVTSTLASPLDDFNFFVAQQYADLTGLKPEPESSSKFVTQLTECGSRNDCIRSRRLDISTGLFLDSVLPTSQFIHQAYLVALGRRPQLSEFESDRAMLRSQGFDDAGRCAFLLAFMQRSEFEGKFSKSLKASEFADALLANVTKLTGVDLSGVRQTLVETPDISAADKVSLLTKTIADQSVSDALYNQVFISTQYFTFLRRDADESGLSFWVSALKNKPLREPAAARSMVCSFLNSSEYQERFGMLTTHTPSECN